ncbi:VanW family protein [Anaerosacchariphilus polymeriproducens]|uniref:G5 domain-containing protein n=1 Tax=Anaerosacchariphilus polymeriproducens TaxID=1812858 RepID=A0A371AYA8_9FIRM|nr:VanW family protein [Anaerosacchariphilus polymeriproducens]RDU24574.1 hypothetical protein DWV06_03670 [Anaerosacchariphilus polymeriproducens]
MKKKLGLIFLACFIIIVGGAITLKTFAQSGSNDTINKGIQIENMDVSGLTQDEAQKKVEQYVSDMQNKSITLKVGSNTVGVAANELGLTWTNTGLVKKAFTLGRTGNIIKRYKDLKDLENEPKNFKIEYSLDNEKIKAVIQEKCIPFCQEAVDAKIERTASGFSITPEKEGITVNVDKSIEAITKFVKESWDGTNGNVEVSVEVSKPKVLAADLQNIKDSLGSFSTNYHTGTGRAQNVANGASKVNGSVVYPGEEFSVYKAVSPFSAENGYELAGSYENGSIVQTYGGGICQVSTTLYNAAIRAEMKITERSPHSMIVDYVQPSMDAAISGTWKDLKFVNNTDTPIYIEGYTGGGQITFSIFGKETRPANRRIEYQSETLTVSEPGTSIVSVGEAVGYVQETQKAHTGKTAKLWKVVYENDKVVSREEFNSSTYQASPRIISVGVSSANPEAVAAMQAAIASQNEDMCRQAASQWNDAALAAAAEAKAQQEAAEEAAKKENEKDKESKKDASKKDKPNDDKASDDNTKTDDTNTEEPVE